MTPLAPRRTSSLALVSALTIIASVGPARAQPPEAAPAVEVSQDDHGASGVIRASVDIDAPPAAVWRVLIDCAATPRLMVNVKSCRVLQHDAAGHWDVRETISKGGLLPGIRTVVHADYDAPSVIRFHRVDGDLKLLDGEWRLTPLDGGSETHLTYESRVIAPFGAPGLIVRAVLRHDMPITLTNLRQACETGASSEHP